MLVWDANNGKLFIVCLWELCYYLEQLQNSKFANFKFKKDLPVQGGKTGLSINKPTVLSF